MSEKNRTDIKLRLLAEITCPNCWHRFPPDQILFVSRHDALIGDDIAGPNAYRRFLPSRFNVVGDAIDARGLACQQLACPRCHLEIARPLIEMPSLFLSIVGGPGTGKSYLLASMTWQMRQLAGQFDLHFADADPQGNYQLHQYEQTLFISSEPDQFTTLSKTEEHGAQLYQTSMIDGQPMEFPRPFQFTLASQQQNGTGKRNCTIVLYDNAGESFLPGRDLTQSPVTQHVARSAAIFFIFDPLQDARFRRVCRADDPQVRFGIRPGQAAAFSRQDIILSEIATRVRRYRGLGQTDKHNRPLIVIMAKEDAWLNHDRFKREPIQPGSPGRLDISAIQQASVICRELLLKNCPEMVSVAEGFCRDVLYVPASALGHSPHRVEGKKETESFYGVRPKDIRPRWTTAPLLWALSRTMPGIVDTC